MYIFVLSYSQAVAHKCDQYLSQDMHYAETFSHLPTADNYTYLILQATVSSTRGWILPEAMGPFTGQSY